MPARAVLFDLGDTLVFQAHVPDREELVALMAQRVEPVLDSWRARIDGDLKALLHEMQLAVDAAQPSWRARGLEVDGAFVARGALAAYGIDASPEQAAEFWRATDVGLIAWGAQLYPDTLDTLRRLRTAGVPTALVSNSRSESAALGASLAKMGVGADLLDVLVTSTDVKQVKPGPAPFLRALDALGIDAADAVFVGDDLECDVRGSKALGMTAVWKLNGRYEVAEVPEADHAIHDLWELFTLDLLPGAAVAQQTSLMPHEDGNAERY